MIQMLKPYFICASLFAGFHGIAECQMDQPFMPQNQLILGNPTEPSTEQIDTFALKDARPGFARNINGDTTGWHPIIGDNIVKIDTNLAEGFVREESGILIEPRFARYTTTDAGLESYSAEIRVGAVTFEKNNDRPSGWFVFAAADGEALSMRTDALTGDSSRTVTLADQITVGDLQAGVSTYIYDGTQLTFSYIETEASFWSEGGLGTSKKESFAGFSLAREF